MWNKLKDGTIAAGKGMLLGLFVIVAFGILNGCAMSTLEMVKEKEKVEWIGSTTKAVAATIAGHEDVTGCEVTVEDEVGRVVCW